MKIKSVEDTVRKKNGKWVNRGDDGKEHGEFDTKKEADAQRKAMFASGYKGESMEIKESKSRVWSTEWDLEDKHDPNTCKYYMDPNKDISFQVFGTIYAPDIKGGFDSFGMDIYDNAKADALYSEEGFETEEDAKKAVEDWFEKYDSEEFSEDEYGQLHFKFENKRKRVKESSDYSYDETSEDDRTLADYAGMLLSEVLREMDIDVEVASNFSKFNDTIEDIVHIAKQYKAYKEGK